jgi:hypothetical protein
MKHKQSKKIKNCPTQRKRQKHIRTEFMSLCPTKRGSYVLMFLCLKKKSRQWIFAVLFQKVSHTRNETEAHKTSEEQNLCPYVNLRSQFHHPRSSKKCSFCLNKCGADPRSPIPDLRKKWHCGHFIGCKNAENEKKTKKNDNFL